MQNEISQLFHRYVDYIDAGKLSAVAELFSDCSVANGDGTVLASGYKEVLAMYTGTIRIYPETNTPQTQHLVSNLIIENQVSENSVRASANFTVLQKLKSGNIETIICGKYSSEFRKIDGEWRFHTHRMRPIIVGDMSEHLLLKIGQIEPQ